MEIPTTSTACANPAADGKMDLFSDTTILESLTKMQKNDKSEHDRFIGTNLANLRKRKEPPSEIESFKKIILDSPVGPRSRRKSTGVLTGPAAKKSNTSKMIDSKEARTGGSLLNIAQLNDLSNAVDKLVEENSLVLKPATVRKPNVKISAASIVQKLVHVPGMETIFVDPLNMSMNLTPCELRETEQGYYLPLKYSQLISRGAAKLKVNRLKTTILVPKKLFGTGGRGSLFDTVVLFRNKIAYVIAILPWKESARAPLETTFPPYIFNIMLKEQIWSLLDENRKPILCREDLSRTVNIQLVDPGIRIYKIAKRLRCVKNELLLNGVEMPREYSVEDLKQDTIFNLLDTMRLRRYFEMAMKEYSLSSDNFFIPKFSNFKLKPTDRIVRIV